MIRKNCAIRQTGVVLLEALVAVFIFSFGILGLVGMYAASIKNSTEAKFRTDAAFLVDSLVAQMQVSDEVGRKTSFASPDGDAFKKWRDDRVYAVLPGAKITGAEPSVVFGTANSSEVTITLKWQAKNDSAIRKYVVTSILDSK
ncbi:type IV pilus modification PilV family protein [Niveibacterium terrae]|uniref:type IV pilus modification PilV family protein n=1 Tax=Niveibacterium terrae TaxID=3373598 RepID=UPI003A8CF010